MERFDLETKQKRYCIQGKHAALICLAVIVTGIAVGLGVGLSQKTSSTDEGTKPTPTAPPTTSDPVTDRGPCKPSNNTNGGWTNFRLPDDITPIHYDLHLEPNLDTDVYTGSVAIHLNVAKASRHLWLHIRETFVSTMPTLQLKGPTGITSIGLKGCFEYTPQEYVVVEATEEVRATRADEYYILTLQFQGWLNGSLVGFYKTTYQEDGEIKSVLFLFHLSCENVR